jgi:hypothetical protein
MEVDGIYTEEELLRHGETDFQVETSRTKPKRKVEKEQDENDRARS